MFVSTLSLSFVVFIVVLVYETRIQSQAKWTNEIRCIGNKTSESFFFHVCCVHIRSNNVHTRTQSVIYANILIYSLCIRRAFCNGGRKYPFWLIFPNVVFVSSGVRVCARCVYCIPKWIFAIYNKSLKESVLHYRGGTHTTKKKCSGKMQKPSRQRTRRVITVFFCSWGQNIVRCCCQLVTHIDSEHFKLSSAVFTSFARVIWARKCIECASSDPWTSEIITAFYRMANELSSRLCGDPEQMSIQSPKTVLHK